MGGLILDFFGHILDSSAEKCRGMPKGGTVPEAARNGQSQSPKEEVNKLLKEARDKLREADKHGRKAQEHLERAQRKSKKADKTSA